MKFITKIKNWIIKKLNKLKIEIIAFETSRNYVAAQEEKAKRCCDKYNAEHENYLASLNAHNATADYAKSISYAADTDYIHKTDVAAMAKAIKEHCENHWACSECALCELPNGCKLAELPCYWEVE